MVSTKNKPKLGQIVDGRGRPAVVGKDGLPERYSSKKDFVAVTKFPEAMLDYARSNGCACVDDHGRVSLTPFLKFWMPHFPRMLELFSESLSDGGDADGLDLNFERAKLTRVQKNTQEIEYHQKAGRIHDVNAVESRMLEIIGPVREGIQLMVKKWHRLKPIQPDIDLQIFEQDLPNFMVRINNGQPALGLLELDLTGDANEDYSI